MQIGTLPARYEARFEAPQIRAIVDALPAMIAYWRRDLICLHANESYLHWFGLRREQVLGHHIREVIGEIPYALNRPYIDGALNGAAQTFERELTRPNGEPATATANYVPDYDKDGHVIGFYVLVVDITHLRRTEEQLRRSEAELRRSLQDSREASAWQALAEQVAHVGHWRVNPRDHTVVWSAEVYRIHGLDPACHTPTLENALNLYHPEDRQRIAAIVENAVRTGQTFEFDARIIRGHGEARHVRSRGMTMADEAGEPVSLFGVFIDITDQVEAERALRAANERLEAMAHRDALTGLANRRHFDAMLEHEWQAAQRAGTPLSMVMIDVDRFKSFNDRYGHQAGDQCLRAVGRAISGIPNGPGAGSARYGGEEFALLLPGADEITSASLAEQTRALVWALAIPHAGNPEGGGLVSVSLGVATARPSKGGTTADLMREADSYLYEAKRTGRNRVVDRWSVVESEGAASDEKCRLSTVRTYLDRGVSRRTAKLDRLAATAARLLGMPIGLVTLVAEDAQILIGNYGLETVTQTPRAQSFCSHTILHDEPLIVLDARQDRRFNHNPLVTGEPGIRFYMGIPIANPEDGQKLGALCVIDRSPHDGVDPKAREVLSELATLVSDLMGELVAA